MASQPDRLRTGPGEGASGDGGPDSRGMVTASVGTPSAMTRGLSQPLPPRPVQLLPSAYPEPSLDESSRLAAVRNQPESRPCLCGGLIWAVARDPGPGVREHIAGPLHQEWRLRGGMYQ